jgi:hypothetical protein
MRCEYHGGFLGHFSWTDARVSRIELSLWKMMSSIILSPEHHQNNKWSKLLGKTQTWPEKLIQEWCWIVHHFIVDLSFRILFWGHISSFNETCLVFVSLLFWNQHMFSILFWQNILIKLQHAINVNQSWRLKVFWLQKWLDDCWNDMITWGDQTNFELIPPETEPRII